MDSSLLNSGCGVFVVFVVESLLWNLCLGIFVWESSFLNSGCGVFVAFVV